MEGVRCLPGSGVRVVHNSKKLAFFAIRVVHGAFDPNVGALHFKAVTCIAGLSLSGGVVGLDDARAGWQSDGVMMVGLDDARAGWRLDG